MGYDCQELFWSVIYKNSITINFPFGCRAAAVSYWKIQPVEVL